MRRIRTFIAVPASPIIRSGAKRLAQQLRPAAGYVKWVPPENLHWTLQFLGEVEDLEIPAVCSAVVAAAADLEGFELSARGAGAFPTPERPRTLWMGAGAGAQAMVALHTAIQKNLDRLGYRSEKRRFVPHVTLGRVGRSDHPQSIVRELSHLAEFDGGSMRVDEVTVYSSTLQSDGPVYDVLARAPLSS